jgi:hypothetical protein
MKKYFSGKFSIVHWMVILLALFVPIIAIIIVGGKIIIGFIIGPVLFLIYSVILIPFLKYRLKIEENIIRIPGIFQSKKNPINTYSNSRFWKFPIGLREFYFVINKNNIKSITHLSKDQAYKIKVRTISESLKNEVAHN